jgi:predicted ATPase/transcriptional regulator with XRE-family HTH domain
VIVERALEKIDRDATLPLGTLLRQFRLAAQLTQEGLADRSGVSARTIQDVERGLRLPHDDTAQRLSRALELTGKRLARFEAAVRPRPRLRGIGFKSRSAELSRVVLLANPNPAAGASTPPTNLPHSLSSFIGRELEVSAVDQLLARSRLVTLSGAGGVGKTRLAVETARRVADRFVDGVWFVDLAPLSGGEFVPGAVADVLHIHQVPHRSVFDQLVDRLATQQILLLFDNCEHLIDDAAGLVHHLLAACPRVAILATSREALRLRGEYVYRVPSLAVPAKPSSISSAGQYASLRLFIERAEEVAGFSLDEANLTDIERICSAVDGIPLAIELAAARLMSLTIAQIAGRLDEQFRLLSVGERTAPPRQRTMRATIDWSYELLTADKKWLWRQLSVFAGGFALEAAEIVGAGCPDLEDQLAQLVDKSLVTLEERNGSARYRLLEPLRQYASEKLAQAGEEAAARDRHYDWCLSLAEQSIAQVHGASVGPFLRRMAAELGVAWACRGVDAEAQHWYDAYLARSAEDSPSAGWALFQSGYMAHDAGYHALGIERLRKSHQIATRFRDGPLMCWSAVLLGHSASEEGDLATARSWLDKGIRLSRHYHETHPLAQGLCALAGLARLQGDHTGSRAAVDELLHYDWIRSRVVWFPCALLELGRTTQAAGNLTEARAIYERSLASFREIGERPFQGQTLAHLGYTLGCLGEFVKAHDAFAEALGIFRDNGHRARAALTLSFRGLVAIREGAHERGITLLAAAEAIPGFFLASLDPSQRADRDNRLADARRFLNEAAFDAAWRQGAAMTTDEAIEFALN